ncbi:HEAT repeat domain-containing protein [Metabacillus iocasae]|uniref:HEAT repeat domain-containing protein n=1 Tax=Priestia iocasae TaxID=2291674 RepID=A0ABS2QTF9_9BACI|nr:HEAT repeat domain-containing protein [Metabacillus iocasae]MBM7702483.1 hypothetical protein [Metabacillus iocasae]
MVNEMSIVLTVMMSLFLLLVILFFYLITVKAFKNRQQMTINNYKDTLRDQLFRYLYEEDNAFIEKQWSPQEMIAIEELLSDYADVVDGNLPKNRIRLYAEKHFTRKYEKALYHRRWSIRMNALYEIEDFYMHGMIAPVLAFYEKRSLTIAEESQVLKILIAFRYPMFAKYIIQTQNVLSQSLYRSLFGRMNKEQFQQCIDMYKDFEEELQLCLIDMIGIQHKLEFASFVESLLSSSSQEHRIRALKALNELSYPIQLPVITPHLTADAWQERMMAAKLLGKTKEQEALKLLTTLIQDSHFSVRSNAAQAMLLIRGGKESLFEFYQTTNDRYAKDMAQEWLEKGGEEIVE